MEDVATCKKLLNDYIEQERTIILAVFSAKNDFGTQAIFSEVKRVDPNFTRTLGIITKPDSTHPGSKSEKLWIKAAKNQEHRFQLGWHTLKNQCEEDREAEPDFLSRGSWAQIEYKHRGIVQLRNRLSTILHRHLLTELPKVRIEIQKQLFVTGDDIKKLGASRATLEEQRRFLSIAEDKARDLIRAAINNQINFDHDFFAVRKQSSGPASDHNSNRLRSATHDLNMLFLHAISTRGRKYELVALKRNRDESHKPRTPASTPGYSPGSSTL